MGWLQSSFPFIGILLLFQMTTVQPKPQKFHLIKDLMNWYEAQRFCRVKHTDLATVNNMEDKNELVNTLGSQATYCWIGLQKRWLHRWMWSDGRGSVHFTKWHDNEPNNQAGNEWCGELSEEGSWNDIPCGEEKGFVCYDRRHDGRPSFKYYSEKKSWVNGQELCRTKHTDMAYVSSESENSEIAELVKTWTGYIGLNNKVWIGLFSDAWMWSDGTETSFRDWRSSTQDQGNCAVVAVSQQGRWVDIPCNDKAMLVCQGGLKVKKMVIRMKVRSDADVGNSTVTDALLKKLETGLKLHFVTDFKLSWRSDKKGTIFQPYKEEEVVKTTGC